MAALWEELRAQELAQAEPDDWGAYLRAACLANFPVSLIRLEDMAGAPPTPASRFRRAASEAERWAVWERDDFTCQHCGTRRRLTVDHIYPYSRGGPTGLDNFQTLCKSCNSSKGNRAA